VGRPDGSSTSGTPPRIGWRLIVRQLVKDSVPANGQGGAGDSGLSFVDRKEGMPEPTTYLNAYVRLQDQFAGIERFCITARRITLHSAQTH
jgi:hypothetical protein